MSEERETRLFMISPRSMLTPDQLVRMVHAFGAEAIVKETCYGCLVEGPRSLVLDILSKVREKYRNEVFREISEMNEGIYNDLLHTADISPKAAEKEGRAYPEEIAAMLNECLRVQAVNKWMPFLEAALFFVLQIILFANI